ncbi:MAG: hypothetical protein ACFFC7_07280 [Candidatus Hermodarchaeota archaeon]
MEVCQEDALEAILNLLDIEKVRNGVVDLPLILDKKYLVWSRWERIFQLLDDEYYTLPFSTESMALKPFLATLSQILEEALRKELSNEVIFKHLISKGQKDVKQKLYTLIKSLSALSGKSVLLILHMPTWNPQIFKLISDIQNYHYYEKEDLSLVFLVMINNLNLSLKDRRDIQSYTPFHHLNEEVRLLKSK